jgi:hypothetical protein
MKYGSAGVQKENPSVYGIGLEIKIAVFDRVAARPSFLTNCS